MTVTYEWPCHMNDCGWLCHANYLIIRMAGRIDVMRTLAGRIDVNSPGLTTETELPINTQVDITTWQYIKIHYITSHCNMTIEDNSVDNRNHANHNVMIMIKTIVITTLMAVTYYADQWSPFTTLYVLTINNIIITTFIRKMGHLR